jgi:hypothetical protein
MGLWSEKNVSTKTLDLSILSKCRETEQTIINVGPIYQVVKENGI